MEIKLLIIVSLLLGSTLGQSIECVYTELTLRGTLHYVCSAIIQNPTGFDGFTTINGTHLEGRTNANVTAVLRRASSRTTNFPQIFCTQFPNLEYVDFSFLEIVELGENTLAECRNLDWIRFWDNRIEQIHERAFVNNIRLTYIDLTGNRLQSIPENTFASLVNLRNIELSSNPYESIPSGLFRNSTELRRLLLVSSRIRELNSQLFASLENLEVLQLYGNNLTTLPENIFQNLRNLTALVISNNPFESIPAGVFRPLTNLRELRMSSARITEINRQWFENLQNLEILHIYSNLFTSIPENVFDNLTSLLTLNIGGNHLTESAIPATLFDNMPNLSQFLSDRNIIQVPNPRWFERLTRLTLVNLNYNSVLELQNGTFATVTALRELDLWDNYLTTVNRNAFGNLSNLTRLDFDGNVINAIDENFLVEATALNSLLLMGNLCVSERFTNFAVNRETFLPRLARCTNNFRLTVDTVTEVGDNYNFFTGQNPGIQVRVNANQNVNIALTPFDFPWTPMVEIFIGVENNTLSRIVRNRETVVVNVPTPNILRDGQWSGFRITWANQVILVTRDGQQFPFMAYTLEDFFPVNFYGLRSPQNRAVWSIQPLEAGIMPTIDID